MKKELIDTCSFGINEKLAKKHNAIVNFAKDNTTYEDGCICAKIESIEYVRRDSKRGFKTIDYIKLVVKVFDNESVVWVNNPKALFIDRKYNMITRVADLQL